MKKLSILMLGIIIGITLAITSSVYADDIKSLVGKAVQGEFPVTLNGKKLDKKAVVIDGASYLPVRIIGDATGFDVTFDANLGVKLTKREGIAMETTSAVVETKEQSQARNDKMEAEGQLIKDKQNNVFKVQNISEKITNKQSDLMYWNRKLTDYTDPIVNDENKKVYGDKVYNETITKYKVQIDKAQSELDDLNNQLIELNKTINP